MTAPTGTPLSPSLGLAEAAKHCGVSVATVRRKKSVLMGYGATTDVAGWKIPYSALIAVGLAPNVTPPDKPVSGAMEPPAIAPVTPVAALELQLVQALARAEKAEAIADERERTIQTQAIALRMLDAAPSKALAQPEPRRWWSRSAQPRS